MKLWGGDKDKEETSNGVLVPREGAALDWVSRERLLEVLETLIWYIQCGPKNMCC